MREKRRTVLKAAAGLGALGLGTILIEPRKVHAAPAGSVLPPASEALTPFRAGFPEDAFRDLKRRLSMTRWPERETVGDWSQGVPLEKARALIAYWRDKYDLRRFEARINAFPQYRTRIDKLGIHFIHARSPPSNALPIVLTHGWPGSFVEFMEVIGPLSDPPRHGGRAEDAFHVVVPSLPGFAFSDKPTETGWDVDRIARAWATLMQRLGYDRWVAQGGDWGAGVTHALAQQRPHGLIAAHVNWQFVFPEKAPDNPTPAERKAMDGAARFANDQSGYFREQATRPHSSNRRSSPKRCERPSGHGVPSELAAATGSRRDILVRIAHGALAGVAVTIGSDATAQPSPAPLPRVTKAVTPFRVVTSSAAISDARRRLQSTRWPERQTTDGWRQGVPLATIQALVAYWRTAYDWRRLERRLNAYPQFRTEIDGLGFHFLHVRSSLERARPIILTHGWPGSVVEFLNVIDPLTDPTKHGGRPEDAFHVVLPSLPGYGFSDKPAESGWGLPRIARARSGLMPRLGYTDYLP